MTEATKTVNSAFGEKQMPKEEFVKSWKDHFSQFFYLAQTTEEYDELQKMRDRIVVLAERQWDGLK